MARISSTLTKNLLSTAKVDALVVGVAAGPTPGSLVLAPGADDVDKAFKKRLKLTWLDAESQLSKNPLSTGRGHGIVAISPPVGYPQEVWDELIRQKKLKKAGQGQYELVEE